MRFVHTNFIYTKRSGKARIVVGHGLSKATFALPVNIAGVDAHRWAAQHFADTLGRKLLPGMWSSQHALKREKNPTYIFELSAPVENPRRKATAPTVPGFSVGTFVQLAPHLDHWMSGDRYGEVVGYARTRAKGGAVLLVKMHRSGKTLRVSPENVTIDNRPRAHKPRREPWAENPPGTVIYSDLVAIIARKTKGGRDYKHAFTTRGVRVLGLPDGSLLIPRGRARLWGRA